MSDWVNHSHLKDVNNASFGFQWCFFLQLRLQGNGRPRATLCMLRIVVFFFTEVSQMKERNLVNSVHDDMLMTFPLDFSEFFSIRLTRKWKTTGHITQAVIFGCFLSWKYRSNQSKTNEASKTKQKKWRSNLSYKLSLRCDI